MSVYPTWRAGKKVTKALLTEQQIHIVQATSDLIRNNTTTQANDTQLVYPLVANARYLVELYVSFAAASATPDIAMSWSVPSGTTGGRFCFGATSSSTAGDFNSRTDTTASFRSQTFSGSIVGQVGVTSEGQHFTETLSLIVGGTAGDLAFRWAPNTANVSNTTRLADSFMTIERVG